MLSKENKKVLHSLVLLWTIKFTVFLYFADVKVSIIVPVTQDIQYLASLRAIVKKSIPNSQNVELILVDEFDQSELQKVAEKPQAQLFMAQKSSLSQKFEAGAFHATGDIFYFLMPGYLPPEDFGIRIIKACQQPVQLGTIPGKWTKRILYCLPFKFFEKVFIFACGIDNLMISKKLFRKIQGLRWDGKDRDLDYLLSNEMVSTLPTKFIQ